MLIFSQPARYNAMDPKRMNMTSSFWLSLNPQAPQTDVNITLYAFSYIITYDQLTRNLHHFITEKKIKRKCWTLLFI
jgi:hypothetical protein